MAKISWKSKEDENKERIQGQKVEDLKKKNKGKTFKNLSTAEKNEILEQIARDMGYL